MKELRSNKEWKKWGEIDPLFGVASWRNKNKGGDSPWTNEEFYKLGESYWRDFVKRWESYGLSKENCLEIGCGAGRITAQLVSYFGSVHAIDVSEKMILYAKDHIENPAVNFHLSMGTDIPLDDSSVNAVFSTHVFQHLDSIPIAQAYFKEIARVLSPGGVIMIHLPIYRWPLSTSKPFGALYALRQWVTDKKAKFKRRLMELGMSKPIMRGLCFSVEFFFEELPKLGFADIEILIFVTKSNNDPHSFILARKL